MFSHFRENTLESVNETPTNDDDEPEMFKCLTNFNDETHLKLPSLNTYDNVQVLRKTCLFTFELVGNQAATYWFIILNVISVNF